MENKIMGKIANIIVILIPYFVRAITSFLKYGFIACILMLVIDLGGHVSVRMCCWIIIISGIVIELIKIVIGYLINRFKKEEEDDESIR